MRDYRAKMKAKEEPEIHLVTDNLVCNDPLRELREQLETLKTPVTELREQLENLRVTPVTELQEPEKHSMITVCSHNVTAHEQPVTVFKRAFSTYIAALCLVLFLILNTSFLIKEQINFYELKGNTFSYSLFVATLTEIAAIFLSFYGTWYRRPILFALLAPTLALIFAVIFLGLERKQDTETTTSKQSEILAEEIGLLKSQKANVEKQIEEGKNLQTALQRLQNRLEYKQEEYRHSLVTRGSNMELWVLAALRILAIVWNIAFASLIAFIWKGASSTPLFPK
jgi:ABC-type multidrug transport system fused ATPase/permease subunit